MDTNEQPPASDSQAQSEADSLRSEAKQALANMARILKEEQEAQKPTAPKASEADSLREEARKSLAAAQRLLQAEKAKGKRAKKASR